MVTMVVFAKMHALLATRQRLPNTCGIAPMAAEWGRVESINTDNLSLILLSIDDVLSSV